MAGKITALKKQARNERRVNVHLDGAFAFALADTLAATLRVGQTLSEAEVADLCRRDQAQRAYERALRFLSYRPRSVDEVARYLASGHVPEDLVAETVARLSEDGLLDDDAFARFWVENRTSFRPRGPAALRYELRRRGVDDATIDRATQDLDEVEAAYRAAQTQALRLRGTDRDTFRRRLWGYLSRRGFPYETVRETVERLWRERSCAEDAAQE
ncbi:MAG: RecX family transcriptional regulator [Anaerolineae bacterium]|nr:RecX family transcriptional regulator [Anaerolineae bacterium]